jgi:DeoR family transcriptional regulator, suf operon transcriptional repressor
MERCRIARKLNDECRPELLKIMDELGFKTGSKTDSVDKNPTTIKAYNCIFHDMAQKHNEVCKFDIALMTALLEKDVELRAFTKFY